MHKSGSFVAALGILLPALLLSLGSPGHTQENLIVSIEVSGNEYISRDAILDAVKNILKIATDYTTEKGTQAKQAIMRMGYFADATVTAEVTPDGTKVMIRVVERKRIEKIAFVGNTVASDSQLTGAILTKVGHVVDNDVIRQDVHRIETFYSRQGYIARVAQARVDDYGVLTFVIDEARLEAFEVKGLKKTKEWVVRRLIETKPGALFKQEDVAKDIQRIFNLGIFQNVKSDLRNGVVDPTAVIVVITVEEKRTGMASIAAAYSELDEFVFMLSVSETNFRGRAETASVNLEAFGRTSYDVRFFEPYLDNKNTSMDVSVFDTERRRRFVAGSAGIAGSALADDEGQFNERRTGASVRLSRPMRPTERFSIGLQSEKVSGSFFEAARNIGVPGGPGVLQVRPRQGDDYIAPPGDLPGPIIVTAPLHPGGAVNSTTFEYTWDTRDIIADPRKGVYRDASWQYAGGLLGGDNSYSLYSVEQRQYFPLAKSKNVVAVRLMLGTSSGDVPLFDSWSVGGAMTLRGYEQDRYRGDHMVLGTVEYRHRLSDSLGLVGFVDAGDAFGGVFPTRVPGFTIAAEDRKLNMHVGAGAGIRAITPLGPIRIDWGFGSEGNQVHFGFGQIF